MQINDPYLDDVADQAVECWYVKDRSPSTTRYLDVSRQAFRRWKDFFDGPAQEEVRIHLGFYDEGTYWTPNVMKPADFDVPKSQLEPRGTTRTDLIYADLVTRIRVRDEQVRATGATPQHVLIHETDGQPTRREDTLKQLERLSTVCGQYGVQCWGFALGDMNVEKMKPLMPRRSINLDINKASLEEALRVVTLTMNSMSMGNTLDPEVAVTENFGG